MFLEITPRLAGPCTRARRRRGALLSVVTGCAILLLATGCGASYSASPGSAADTPGSFSAYQACLRQHGVTIPTAPPSGGPPGSGAGGFGGFGGGSGGSSAFAKAAQACAKLRPSGSAGPGGGFGGGFVAALREFRSCMAAHGEKIPSTRPTGPPTGAAPGADRFLNGLNPDNRKVAAALKACQSKLPSFVRPG
jgi:hypothetical protein